MKSLRKKFGILAFLFTFGSIPVFANELVVSQKGKEFFPKEIKVKVGQKITFINDDKVAHNVFSKAVGNDFNLKIQKPGDVGEAVFKAEGELEVRCAIHPKMVLKVKVEK
jgi:plastocyanin